MKKSVIGVHPSPQGHWVGDGFPVRSLFSYDGLGARISPFLLLDYAGPAQFSPTQMRRGVGAHPHRGFETVTIVYRGEVAHRDSAGNNGVIGPGDVQWMTAASGILHEEYHSPAFSSAGGFLEMAQLWVNLPARYKMSAPRYQSISSSRIPSVLLQDDAGTVRVIAGCHAGAKGPASTFSELNVWDVRMAAARTAVFSVPEGHNAAIALFSGRISANGSRSLQAAELVVFDVAGDEIQVQAGTDSNWLFLSGAPISEPIVGRGPFVMNSQQEIETAMRDFQTGRFGSTVPR